MYWAPFFHIYQPPGQMTDILERIVNESYRKFIKGLKENPKAKITLNINASLTEQLFDHGYSDVIDGIKGLAERGQIEFTESAKYHAFLPLTPWEEIIRQITINRDTNKKIFGSVYNPVGFFPPEMAYDRKIADIVSSLGYKWLLIDEIAYNGKVDDVPFDCTFEIRGLKGLQVFFRERRTSNLIMGAVVRSEETLLEALEGEDTKNRYLLTAMDGETFGHHRPGLEKFLFEIFASKKFKLITISEIEKFFPKHKEVDPIPSTWSSAEADISAGKQFLSWNDPKNKIHSLQWELYGFVHKIVTSLPEKKPYFSNVREKLDRAMSSDHFWWASALPWWSLEMIELGAWRLLDVLKTIPDIKKTDVQKAERLYQRIVLEAFEWQRTGYIRRLAAQQRTWTKIPFQERAKSGEYPAFLETMKKQMEKAAKNREYEKAILWRDAITKLEQGTDVYDAIHVVDQLRASVPPGEIEKLVDKYKKIYKQIRGGQPEQRG